MMIMMMMRVILHLVIELIFILIYGLGCGVRLELVTDGLLVYASIIRMTLCLRL